MDLSTLAADALLPFDPVFFEQGLMLSSQLAEGINVNGDAGRLKEVLDILLDNARKYTEPSGTVSVYLERWGPLPLPPDRKQSRHSPLRG